MQKLVYKEMIGKKSNMLEASQVYRSLQSKIISNS